MNSKTRSMSEGNILKILLTFTLPLLGGNLFQQAYNLVDAAIVGKILGSNALAAVGTSTSVQFFVLGFGMGVAIGMSIPVATKFGAEMYHDMRQFVYIGAVLTAIMGADLTILTVIFCPAIIRALKTPAELYRDAYVYLVTIFAGIPFMLLYNYLAGILRAVGDSKTPFYFLALSSLLNIGLDLFFIIVLNWGCFGAAFATIISQAVSGILCLLLIRKKFDILHLRKEDRVWDNGKMRHSLNMGLPMGFQFSVTAIGAMVLQACNNTLGTVYVAGYASAMKIKSLFICPYDALATAAGTFASQNFGAAKSERIHKGLRTAIAIGLIYSLLATLLMTTCGRAMSLMFLDKSSTAILDASAQYVGTIGKGWSLLGILLITRQTVQGLGWSKQAVVGGMVEMVARSIVCLGFTAAFGFTAICFADIAAWITCCMYLVPLVTLCLRRTDNIIAGNKTLYRQ